MIRSVLIKRLFSRAALCGLLLAGARAEAAAPGLEAPACGARIFVVMGVNQNYPQRENMRVPVMAITRIPFAELPKWISFYEEQLAAQSRGGGTRVDLVGWTRFR